MILPDLARDSKDFTLGQTIAIAIVIYGTVIIFTQLLFFCLYNIYYFLYKQGKWRVFPLTVFYILSVAMCIVRIYGTIIAVKVVAEW